MGRVIAIDGPSGAGKSSVAKAVAERLGFSYLDTGALYRATALGLRRAGIAEDAPGEAIAGALRNLRIAFRGGRVYLGGEDVSEAIRTPEAGHLSSVFSARPEVREFLMPVQKAAAESGDLVAEGRDMGTVVFPGAWRKFFLDATMGARAGRRHDQLLEKGMAVDMDKATHDVRSRDERDSSREHAPLRRADDAVYIDSSELTLEQVIERVMKEAGA